MRLARTFDNAVQVLVTSKSILEEYERDEHWVPVQAYAFMRPSSQEQGMILVDGRVLRRVFLAS